MRKILSLLFIVSFFCLYSCSTEEEVASPEPTPTPTPEPTPVEGQDTLFYSLEAKDFEVVAVTNDKVAAFMQRDTLFDFRCLFDSCQSNRLAAYCDSSGIVERICVEDNVFDFLYHKDRSKLDILYKKDGKLDFIKDVENPFKDIDTRTESGDVPFSAIHALTRASYGIYTIINAYPMTFGLKVYGYMKKYSAPPFHSELALDYIVGIYEAEYGQLLGNYYAEIASIMKDYARWVRQELYGDAIPLVKDYAERRSVDIVEVYAFVNDVEEEKKDFRVGIMIQKNEDPLFSSLHRLASSVPETYNSEKTYYSFPFAKLPTSQKYKVKTFLAPLASSKYLDGAKSLIDYYKYGTAKTFDLLEAKANLVSRRSDKLTIDVSVKNIDRQKIKMGLYYGLNPELPENDRKIVQCNIGFNDYAFSDVIARTVELENLIPDTSYYYMPYVIYEGNLLNRPYHFRDNKTRVVETYREADFTFLCKKDTIRTKDKGKIDSFKQLNAMAIGYPPALPTAIFECKVAASIKTLDEGEQWGVYYLSGDDNYEFLPPFEKKDFDEIQFSLMGNYDDFDEIDMQNYKASKKIKVGVYRFGDVDFELSEPQEYTLVYDTPPSIYFTDFQIISTSSITPGEDGNDMQSDYYMSFNVHGALFISDIFQSFNGKQSLLGAVEVMDGSYSLQGSLLYSSSYEEPPATGYLRMGITSNAKDIFSPNYIVLDWGSGSFYLAGKANSSTRKLGKHQKIEVENIIRHVKD